MKTKILHASETLPKQIRLLFGEAGFLSAKARLPRQISKTNKDTMKTEHTKGPWIYYLTISDNGPVPQVQTVPVGPVGGAYATMICTLSQTGKKSGTQLANARLIAAAPDLLAALEYLLPIAEKNVKTSFGKDAVRIARAAIAKAEGNA